MPGFSSSYWNTKKPIGSNRKFSDLEVMKDFGWAKLIPENKLWTNECRRRFRLRKSDKSTMTKLIHRNTIFTWGKMTQLFCLIMSFRCLLNSKISHGKAMEAYKWALDCDWKGGCDANPSWKGPELMLI